MEGDPLLLRGTLSFAIERDSEVRQLARLRRLAGEKMFCKARCRHGNVRMALVRNGRASAFVGELA